MIEDILICLVTLGLFGIFLYLLLRKGGPGNDGIAFIILSIGLGASCSPDYYISKYCPVVSDSTFTNRVDTVIQHDTIFTIAEKIVTVHDTVPCDDFTIEKDSGGVSMFINVTNGVLRGGCKCDSIEIKFKWSELRRTITTHREINRAIYRYKKKSWFTYWETWAVISGLLFLLIIKILKLTKKWPLPFP